MSATLGGLLKDYRLQKNISQLEISFAVGWKEPSRLSRIEQGRVGRPKRDLLNRIMDAMKLDEEERNRLLLAGGYLPTDEEIEKVRKEVDPAIKKWKYPAIIYDFTLRIVHENKISAKTYNMSKTAGGPIDKTMPNLLEIMYHPDNYMQRNMLTDHEKKELDELLIQDLNKFKYQQRYRTKEKWYTQLIQKLMNRKLFRALWEKVQTFDDEVISSYWGREPVPHPEDTKKRLDLFYFMVPVVKDPRFFIEFYTPADLETFKYFEKK